MLHYEFMRLAFLVGILLGLALPLVGSTAVFKRLSASGDALAHASLAGVVIGLVAGMNPLWVSLIACIVSLLIIEWVRRRFNKYAELSVTVVLCLAVALAGVLSGYVTSGNIDSYLFGSLLLVDWTEIILAAVLFVLTIAFYLVFHQQIFATIYHESEAKAQGVPTNFIQIAHAILFAVAIAISAKTIGSLVVSSLVAIPVATALQARTSYRKTLLLSMGVSLVAVIVGISFSYLWDWRPGASVALCSVCLLLLFILARFVGNWIKKKRALRASSIHRDTK